jgi:hypothetical protein
MMANREDNARMLDPNRFKIAQQNAVMPGGPMNNNPMNVTNFDNSSGSLSGVNQFPYGDSGLENDGRMGSAGLFPQPGSGKPQQFTAGVGLNGGFNYGLQPQPDSRGQETFEGARMGMEAQAKQLNTSQYMGIVGLPAQPAPGGVVPSPQQTERTLGLQGVQTAEVPPKGMDLRSGKRK